MVILAGLVSVSVLSPVNRQSSFDPSTGDRFFSGTVSESTEEAIAVTRSVLGKKPVVRRFVITPETRIEGEVRPRVRVTVRYITEEQGDRAVHIIVREKRPR
jgi:hypothetical protein